MDKKIYNLFSFIESKNPGNPKYGFERVLDGLLARGEPLPAEFVDSFPEHVRAKALKSQFDSLDLSDELFVKLSEKDRTDYAVKLVKRGIYTSDLMWDALPQIWKDRDFISNLGKFYVTEHKFKSVSGELRRKHLERKVYEYNGFQEFEWKEMPEDLKALFFEKFMKGYAGDPDSNKLEGFQYLSLPESEKLRFAAAFIDLGLAKWESKIREDVFVLLPENMKRRYVEELVKKRRQKENTPYSDYFDLSQTEYNSMGEDLKRWYDRNK